MQAKPQCEEQQNAQSQCEEQQNVQSKPQCEEQTDFQPKLQWEEKHKFQQEQQRQKWEQQQKLAEERRAFLRELAEERLQFQQEIAEERRKFLQEMEQDKRNLELKKQDFYLKKELEEKKISEQERLFQIKWKILEEELRKLASEKEKAEKTKRHNYHRSSRHQEKTRSSYSTEAELFFTGVENKTQLKKRYKELIKIFHPDNSAGDTETLQMINRVYEELKKQFAV